ncbi:hypothetical protein N1851_017119 [Merluccius polli]|uniref:Uncharacterized protein n=1 Tax=Merluccius polli TaxID=89951 RepID=A0AA47MQS8_MERPO|nr:hypothetical protein N1851_017119 [Merluccius polli]
MIVSTGPPLQALIMYLRSERRDIQGFLQVLLELCAELRPALQRNTARSQGLSVPTQVLTTLGFLATGAFQQELDRSVPVNPEPSHASCVGRNYPNVIQTLGSLLKELKVPSSSLYSLSYRLKKNCDGVSIRAAL